MKPSARAWIGAALGLVVSAACIVVGVLRIDWSEAYAAFSGVKLNWVGAGVCFTLLSFLTFAKRWRAALSPPQPPTWQLLRYLMVGYMTNAVLPMRPGELLRAALLRSRHNLAFANALSSVVIERVFDLLVLVAIGCAAALYFPLPDVVQSSLAIFAMFGFGALVIFLVISHRDARAVAFRRALMRYAPQSWVRFVRSRTQPFLDGVRVLHGIDAVSSILCWSAVAWLCLVLAIASFLHALAIDATWLAAPIVVVITSLGAAIPSSPGALGVYHALFVFALSLFGVPAPIAVAAALIAHTSAIALHLGLGAISGATLGPDALRAVGKDATPGNGTGSTMV